MLEKLIAVVLVVESITLKSPLPVIWGVISTDVHVFMAIAPEEPSKSPTNGALL